MNVYIPNIQFELINRKDLFILTRPFLGNAGWENNLFLKEKWGIAASFTYVSTIEGADVYFIPKPVQQYSKQELHHINTLCKKHKIKAYGIIAGDFGPNLGNYSHIVFYRMGGFKMQLGNNNQGFPVMLSDHFERIYKQKEIEIRQKQKHPIVGFCGHATLDTSKRIKECLKFIIENGKRFLNNPFRSDYEPLFPSAYERAKLLRSFELSNKVKTNFIYRKHYRGGAVNEEQREKTTLEYYDNIKNSDYVLCVRGGGNFSVRLYETLMMGRIPIFVNTDCLLPFKDDINWREHVVWVEWKESKNIAKIVSDFHENLTNEAFENLQLKNRRLWKEGLSISKMLEYIDNDI